MLTVLLILLGLYVVYRLFRSRSGDNQNSYRGGNGGFVMGGMLGGMVLGYLLSNYLIDQHQYDMWRNMDDDELRETLTSNGILKGDEFDDLLGQAEAGDLPDVANQSGWDDSSQQDTVSNSFDDYQDNDFGGDDWG